MRRVTIAVIGNKKTTRANVEALIGDMFDSVDEAKIALIYRESKSDGQVWAEQFAKDSGVEVVEYPENNWVKAMVDTPSSDLRVFALWDEEDEDCLEASQVAAENSITVYDLSDGLLRIPVVAREPRTTSDMPAIELEVSDEPIEPQYASESSSTIDVSALTAGIDLSGALKSIQEALEEAEYGEDDDLTPEQEEKLVAQEDFIDILSIAFEEAGRSFARAFVQEFTKLLGK